VHDGLPVDAAELLLAGVDFPAEEQAVRAGIEERGWARSVSVDNDTFAVLRAGTDAGWGVAVVCGAGINCVGVAPDGRQARFRALGWTTGDWGGGAEVGRDAVWAAARSEDGRGPKTVLERLVPAHFGLSTPSELAEAVHFGRIDGARAIELAPVVFAAAADDPVAAGIVDRLAAEVVALSRVAITRLGLERDAVEVLLGGGLLRHPTPGLLAAIERGLAEVGPAISVHSTSAPPILGATFLALDALGAEPSAYERARATMGVVPVG
jgi:N-acetylglucosamine kinase-like BadF-type ATPase